MPRPVLTGPPKSDDQVLRLNRLSYSGMDFADETVRLGIDRGLHFHGFHHEEFIALRDSRPDRDIQDHQQTGNWRGDLQNIRQIRFRARL